MLYIHIQQQLTQLYLYPPYLAQSLGFWVTCGVKMMSLRQGWGWQPLQTASLIRIRHIWRKSLSTLIFVMLPLPSLHWYLCSCCAAVFTVVELAPSHCAVTFIKMALLLSLNWRDGPLLLHARRQVASAFTLLPMQLVSQWKRRTSFQWHINWQQQAHQQDPRGCVGSKSPSQVLTELGNVGLSWQEGGWNRMWFQCIVCHSGYKRVQWLYLRILCNPCY